MKRSLILVTLVGVALAAPLSSGAADAQQASTTVTITKHVVGTALPGTVFTVRFMCDAPVDPSGQHNGTMSFDATGAMTAPTGSNVVAPVTPTGATAAQTINFTLGTASAQTPTAFNITSRSADGAAIGQLQGVTVDGDGTVKASFSNGDVKSLGKVVLANFTNPAGLRQLGDSTWAATGVSGAPAVGSPGSDGFGNLMSSTIERSNVDITEELVSLIAAQRNFQANAKALDTASQISQTIFNIRS